MNKIVLFGFVVALLSGCASSDWDKVKFELDRIGKHKESWPDNSPSLYITLSSETDILELIEEAEAVNFYLYCPLEEAKQSGVAEKQLPAIISYASDTVKSYPIEGGRYAFHLPITFDDDQNYRRLTYEETIAALEKETDISCKVILAYMTPLSPNQSSLPFLVKAADLLAILKEK